MDIHSPTKKPLFSGPSSNVHRCSPRRSLLTGGIVYYANYLKFFERARTEWLRAAGYEQRRLSEEFGLQFVVAQVQCDYRQPARMDDLLEIDLRVLKSGRVFIVFEQTARRGATVLATATVKAGCIDSRRFVPAAMPAELLNAFRTLPGSLRTS